MFHLFTLLFCVYAWKAVFLAKVHLFRLGDYGLSYFKGIEEYVIVILFSIPRGASNKPQFFHR